MEYKLTSHIQYSKKCKDGKSRNFLLYFLNDILIFKQKVPFDTDYEKGFDRRTWIHEDYLMNGKIYQTRTTDYKGCFCVGIEGGKHRNVSFPVSKKRLEQFNIPKDLKIEAE